MIKAIQPSFSARRINAHKTNVQRFKETVLPKFYDTAARENALKHFLSLDSNTQNSFLIRLFSKDTLPVKYSTIRDEGHFQVLNSIFNKSEGVPHGFADRLKKEQHEKLMLQLKLNA